MTGFRYERPVTDNAFDLVTTVEQGNFERKTTIALFLDIKQAW